jgi:hypothetical protein
VTTRILADLGADVIKIERRGSIDFGDRRGGLSGTLMRGKRSIVLNLDDPRALDLARRLAAISDVVIDNFSARVMTNLGLDYDALRKVKPDVICVRMTGFGLTGPDRDHVSYGPTLQALTGYTLLMAEPDGPPAGFGYSYSDLAGGNLGALAVLAALWHRRRTGRGQLVDLSQLEAVASLVGPTLLGGGTSAPTGNASQEAPGAPHGVYPCAGDDRWIAITVFSDAEWERFATAAGGPGVDARYALRDHRWANPACRGARPARRRLGAHARRRGHDAAPAGCRRRRRPRRGRRGPLRTRSAARGARALRRRADARGPHGAHRRTAVRARGHAGGGRRPRPAPRRAHRRGSVVAPRRERGRDPHTPCGRRRRLMV